MSEGVRGWVSKFSATCELSLDRWGHDERKETPWRVFVATTEFATMSAPLAPSPIPDLHELLPQMLCNSPPLRRRRTPPGLSLSPHKKQCTQHISKAVSRELTHKGVLFYLSTLTLCMLHASMPPSPPHVKHWKGHIQTGKNPPTRSSHNHTQTHTHTHTNT